MIFYFSGTGNSLYAARVISEEQGEQLISIAKEFDKGNKKFVYELKENELLGFVYPVYAWGPPKIVLDFIKKLIVTGNKPYVFSLCTCGDEEGYTTRTLEKALEDKGLTLNSAFTIRMPNNYIFGFDVDTEEVEQDKLKNSESKLKEINTILFDRQTGHFQLIIGKTPSFKSGIVNSLFNRFSINTKKFYATDECTGCGLCEEKCPVHTITVKEKPIWGKLCTQCLACINHCPVHAIQYGKSTVLKGRYIHPHLRVK